MSLTAWYKLNGDLLDSSGNGNHLRYLRSTGALVQETGGVVLPNSYKRTTINTTDVLRSLKTVNLSGPFSMSCWCKVNAFANAANGIITNHDHATNNGAGITLKAISVDDCRISCNTGEGTGRTYNSYYGTTNIFNKWAHLVLSYDGTKIRLYVNGLKEFETNTYYNMSCKDDYIDLFNWSTSYAWNGNYRPAVNLQDVRIYDHCLSDKEIYDLSKAKVLHYTFDDVEEPTINLLYNSGAINLEGATDVYNRATKENLGNGKYKFTNTGSDVSTIRLYCNLPDLINGETYTFSVYYEGAEQDTCYIDFIDLINSEGNQSTFGRLTVTGKRATYDSTYRFFDIAVATGKSIILFNPQLEKKDHATPFVNGTRDNIIVRDKSEYGNDSLPLTVATTPAFVEDCKIGKQGTEFTLTESKVEALSTLFDMPALKPMSVVAWIKPTVTGFYQHIVSNRQAANVFDWMFFLHVSDNALSFRGSSQNKSAYVPPLNKWTHVAATVSTDGILKMYANGEKVYEISGYQPYGGAMSTGRLTIGHPWYEPNERFRGGIDDIRIYATALTAADVKEIYQSRANLDDKGNLSVALLNQQGVTSISLTEKGVYNTVEISEVGVTEGLIAWYPLNGDAKDYSGNGNDGVVYGATVAAGQGQKCYSFDGSASKIMLPKTFLRLPAFSCSLWFDWENRDSISRTLFSMTELGGWRISLSEAGSPNSLSFQIYDTSTYRLVPIPNSSIPTGWNNVSVSYDNISKLAILYINAVEVARTTLTNGLTYGTEVNPLIGCEASVENANSSMFNGSIQDVRIYNRALTQEEVLINYNLTKSDKIAMIQAENGTTYVNKIKEV